MDGNSLDSQKVFMKSDQLHYSAGVVKKFQRINQFLALFYVPAWPKASIGSNAFFNESFAGNASTLVIRPEC